MMVDEGLTLIEMLAVMAILGIAAGATALSLAPAGEAGVRTQATGLARDLTLAADAALAGAPPARFAVDRGGYILGDVRRDLPDGMRLDAPVPSKIEVGETPPFDVTLTDGSQTWRVRFDGLRATAVRAGMR